MYNVILWLLCEITFFRQADEDRHFFGGIGCDILFSNVWVRDWNRGVRETERESAYIRGAGGESFWGIGGGGS